MGVQLMPSGSESLRYILLLVISLTGGFPVSAFSWSTIEVEAEMDNTLYQTEMDIPPARNELSNGQGIFLFAGRTGLDAGFRNRRALVKFDLSVLPDDAEVLSAELVLYLSRAAPGAPPSEMTLHRVLQPWGEGISNAAGPEGQGALAEKGDATWFHSEYSTQLWSIPGGSFQIWPSAVTTVGSLSQDYVWPCTRQLLGEINTWLNVPEENSGWLLLGFEDGARNARRFHSREHPEVQTRPRLRLIYRTPDMVFADGFESLPGCG